ncbi:MAG: hypothetical protein HON53_11550 [Planctomycetaceae bacterium]|jgi:hypothetical protein|nr:hypothetical protein [Planctomycetaceae bacterium]MBT6155782.1 hypothetical protein [Planctomycetaceae bacterium]MBT6483522.1 hypothetical protein [Planctomycetaceae bacterium]MBT6493153.1 hypothetical protein [Planctomycetaceae bacterium]
MNGQHQNSAHSFRSQTIIRSVLLSTQEFSKIINNPVLIDHSAASARSSWSCSGKNGKPPVFVTLQAPEFGAIKLSYYASVLYQNNTPQKNAPLSLAAQGRPPAKI